MTYLIETKKRNFFIVDADDFYQYGSATDTFAFVEHSKSFWKNTEKRVALVADVKTIFPFPCPRGGQFTDKGDGTWQWKGTHKMGEAE